MTALIVYDSKFGNTADIAHAIAEGLGTAGKVTMHTVTEADPVTLAGYDLIIAGAPTHAFRPSPPMKKFLGRIPKGSLTDTRIAAFDTRIAFEDIDITFVRWMARMFGYAAPHILKRLVSCGGTAAASPEGFFVGDTEGPIKEGDLERAKQWGAKMVAAS